MRGQNRETGRLPDRERERQKRGEADEERGKGEGKEMRRGRETAERGMR